MQTNNPILLTDPRVEIRADHGRIHIRMQAGDDVVFLDLPLASAKLLRLALHSAEGTPIESLVAESEVPHGDF